MAEWPCCHDPLRFSPASLRFVPPPSPPPPNSENHAVLRPEAPCKPLVPFARQVILLKRTLRTLPAVRRTARKVVCQPPLPTVAPRRKRGFPENHHKRQTEAPPLALASGKKPSRRPAQGGVRPKPVRRPALELVCQPPLPTLAPRRKRGFPENHHKSQTEAPPLALASGKRPSLTACLGSVARRPNHAREAVPSCPTPCPLRSEIRWCLVRTKKRTQACWIRRKRSGRKH